jgi:hypothetical protein
MPENTIKITSEDDILKENTRKSIIDEVINGWENIDRRFSELRKHEIYRDKNRKWIMHQLFEEGFKDTTLYQMQNRASNISICRKITNKLANTYTGGVSREVDDAKSLESIELLTKELDVNTKMRKSDRYRQLFRNTLMQVVPQLNTRASKDAGKELFDLVLKPLAPWQYDVIEDPNDLTKPMIVMLSDFWEQHRRYYDFYYDHIKGSRGQRPAMGRNYIDSSNRRDDKIADSRNDKDMGDKERKIIWWSEGYHFTTDANGTVIDTPFDGGTLNIAGSNPISRLPFVNITGDQDGFYWSYGGEDVVEGSLLINKQLTDVNFISFTQGWGQMVIAAENIPKVLKGGPDNAFIFQLKQDSPRPEVFFASSNPPIMDWLETIKSELAMILSTNDLAPRNIAAKLDASNAASGIAMIIEQAESIADTQDVQQLFRDREPEIWELIRRWHELYSDSESLTEDLQEIPPFEDSNVKLKFHQLKPVISEKEHLENIKARKEVGLDTMVDLIQKDNPDLTEDEAKEKADEVMKEKTERQQTMIGDIFSNTKSNLKPKPDEDEDEEPEQGAGDGSVKGPNKNKK